MYEPEENPRSLSRFVWPIGGAIVVAGIVLAALFALGYIGGNDDDGGDQVVAGTPTPSFTATPEADPVEVALGQFVNARMGASYSGDCASAMVSPTGPTPVLGGEAPGAEGGTPEPTATGISVCSQERGEREGVRAYVLRLPLAEPSWWAFVEEVNGVPQVVSEQEITPEIRQLPGTPWPLETGVEVVVVGGDCLNVREGPALDQAAVDCIADGTPVLLSSGPVEADGFRWWQLDGRAGWVAAEFLRYADSTE